MSHDTQADNRYLPAPPSYPLRPPPRRRPLGLGRWTALSLVGLAGGVALNVLAMITLGGVSPTVGDVLLGALFGVPVGVAQMIAWGRRLGWGWVVACTIGFSAMTTVVLGPLELVYADNFLAQGVLHGLAAGLCVGLPQFFYLRDRTRHSAAWVPASVAIALVAEFIGRGVGVVAEDPLNLLALFWSWQIMVGVTLKRHFATF